MLGSTLTEYYHICPFFCVIRRTLVIPHTAPKATGEFLSEAAPSAQFLPTFPKAFHSYPLETAPHSLNSPSRKKKRRRRGGGGEKKRPLRVLLCPLITRLSLKQMADHRPVYINTCSFERGVQKLGLALLEIHESQIIEIKASSICCYALKKA